MISRVQIGNKKLEKKKREIFRAIINKLGETTMDDLKTIEMYFILDSINNNFLQENTLFNKTSKKYSLKPV
jgi:hypothetical protein